MGQVCFKAKSKKNKELLYKVPSPITQNEEKSLNPKNKNTLEKKSRFGWFKKNAKLGDMPPKFDKRFSKNSSHFKYLKDISLEVQRPYNLGFWLKDSPPAIFTKFPESLKNFPAVKKLRLSFCKMTNIDDDEFIEICKEMKNLVFVKHLTININHCNLLTDKAIECLVRCIKGFTELEAFKLCISNCYHLTSKTLRILGKSLKHLRKLKSLYLVGICVLKINNEDFRLFCENMKKLKGLKELSLVFPQFDEDIFSTKNLGLLFEGRHNLTLERVLKSLESGLSNLKELTNLRLNFERCFDYENENCGDFKSFFSFLESFACLKNVHIGLQENPNEYLRTQFNDSNFSFSCNQFWKPEDLKPLAQYLKQNRLITSITLDLLENKEIQDMGLEILAEAFREHPTIKEIALDLIYFKEFTGKGLKRLGECLNPSVIQSVFLDFSGALEFNEGVESFCQNLERLTEMRFLRLKFPRCKILDVKNKAAENIVQSVKKMTKLESFTLNFSKCLGVTNETLAQFKETLENLPCLERLVFSLAKNEVVTNEGLNYLNDGIKSLKKLREIQLYFVDCQNIRIDEMEDLKQQILGIKDTYVKFWNWNHYKGKPQCDFLYDDLYPEDSNDSYYPCSVDF